MHTALASSRSAKVLAWRCVPLESGSRFYRRRAPRRINYRHHMGSLAAHRVSKTFRWRRTASACQHSCGLGGGRLAAKIPKPLTRVIVRRAAHTHTHDLSNFRPPACRTRRALNWAADAKFWLSFTHVLYIDILSYIGHHGPHFFTWVEVCNSKVKL